MNQVPASQIISHFKGLPVIQATLARLEAELAPDLYYHSAAHTRDVLEVVLTLGVADNLTYEQLYLLALAAVFHDIGFLEKRQGNEDICARMAGEALLEQTDLDPKSIETIQAMILDTALQTTPAGPRQLPRSFLAGYLLDADLGNLGRADFLDMSELVRQEIGITNKTLFYQGTLGLFDAHQWNSAAAARLFQSQKEQNRERLLALIADMQK